MKKQIRYMLALIAGAILLACCDYNQIQPVQDQVEDGFISLEIPFKASDAVQVNTKAVDPDGKGINSLTLFCFDNFGLFISYIEIANSNIVADGGYPSLSGTINNLSVPENTRRIHLVANQNMASFDVVANKGKNEETIMTALESSSGMMIYWGRFAVGANEADSAQEFKEALKAHGPVMMLRNQARFTVEVSNSRFINEGFTVVNTMAFGTIAPLHPQKKYDFTMNLVDGRWDENCDWVSSDFITLPALAKHNVKLSNPADVDIAEETCVFETDNKSSDPVSVIIKGKNGNNATSLYYRIMLIDEKGEYVKVRRNHHYTIHIEGSLSFGQSTFEGALTAPATNNVWVSIDDEVNEVQNNEYILKVEKTSVAVVAEQDESGVYSNPEALVLYYSLEDVEGKPLDADDAPVVTWLDNEVASENIYNDFILPAAGQPQHISNSMIQISLNNIGDSRYDGVEKLEGTLLVKKGLLQRKIKVIILKKQLFVPVWMTTQVYGGNVSENPDSFKGANATLLFTVPQTCPDELLPFEVYISVNHLDVRAESGAVLPVITASDPRYGSDVKIHPDEPDNNETIGYKYVYTVKHKGDQSVYFRNILSQPLGHTDYVTLESPYFESVCKPYNFTSHTNGITVNNTVRYNAFGQGSDEQSVYYMLVPQKINAPVDLRFALQNGDGNPIESNIYSGAADANGFDEFLLYSKYLNHITHNSSSECTAEFMEIDESLYGTGGRIQAMRLTKEAVDGEYIVNLYTTKSNSAELVRLSSNQPQSPSAWLGGTYNMNTYRSFVFELANYRPFRFMAQVNGAGNGIAHDNSSSEPEQAETIYWDYTPNQPVDISFDITEFQHITQDNKTVSVDPFGTPFEVYIEAPMLEIDQSKRPASLSAEKFYYDQANARFVYVVDADRAVEASYFNGERKTLPFKLKSGVMVTQGTIKIYSNTEKVVYQQKVFNVRNSPITGSISINRDGVISGMKEGAFVSFALTRNNSRIGSMTIISGNGSAGSSSTYQLSLRPEYEFGWENDPLVISHTHTENGVQEVFTCEVADLKTLMDNPDIVLTLQQ